MKYSIKILFGIVIVFFIIIFSGYYDVKGNIDKEENEKINHIEFVRDEAKDVKVIKIAHSYPRYSPQNMALVEKFSQIVGEESDWNIIVEIFPNNELGKEEEYLKGVGKGTVEMCIASESISEYIPTLKALNLPYFVDDYKQLKKIMNSNIIRNSHKNIESLGVRSLTYSFNGFKQISTFEKEIGSKEQELQLNIGTISASIENKEALEKMGFMVQKVDGSSLDRILKQREVDGHVSSVLESFYNGWYKGQNHLYILNLGLEPTVYLINEKFWNQLNSKEKGIVEKAARESAKYVIELFQSMEEDIYRNLEKQGMNIVKSDSNYYKKNIQPLYEKWIDEENDLKLVNKLKGEIE